MGTAAGAGLHGRIALRGRVRRAPGASGPDPTAVRPTGAAMTKRTYRLPGVCISCRAAVVWDGKRWLDAPKRGSGTAHHCGTIG